jgi:hypothetical protein
MISQKGGTLRSLRVCHPLGVSPLKSPGTAPRRVGPGNSITVPGGLPRPTGHEVVRHLEFLQGVRDPDGTRHIALDPLFHATCTAILAAAGMDATVFTTPPIDSNTDQEPSNRIRVDTNI